MCGINGLVGTFGGPLVDRLELMNAVTAHRGPDDSGIYVAPDGSAGLGQRRLSILDLSAAGRQPMSDPDDQVHLVFNGEIYNFRELRTDLEGRGYRFRSQTDTEVLLYLYLADGERMLDRLNGIFSFAVWDERSATLFAARDHLGIKPFYYAALPGDRLVFSSEAKSLLTCPEVPRDLNLPALADYLSFLWVSDPLTLFRGIQKLPPGHKLRWRRGRIDVEPWWDLDFAAPDAERPEGDWAEELRDRFDTAVRRQLVSDVPVGAFLSGGLDSSGIVAAASAAHRGEFRCYTIAYDSGDNAIDQFADDLPYARAVATHLGVTLNEVRVTPEIATLWPKVVWHLDEPIADPAAINCYLISKLAREDGTKVLLSGQGADELFAGYRWHLGPELMRALGRLPKPVGRWLARGSRLLPGAAPGRLGGVARRLRKLLAGAGGDAVDQFVLYCHWMTAAERRDLLDPQVAPLVNARDTDGLTRALLGHHPGIAPLNARLYRDLKVYLPGLNLNYTDKASMAAGVECRVPFLDLDLIRLATRIPPGLKLKRGRTKHILRAAFSERLPRFVLERPKTGFGVPLRKWIKDDLHEMIGDLLSPSTVRQRGLFRWEAVERLRRDVEQGSGDRAYVLWALMTLELWQQTFLDPAIGGPIPKSPASLTSAAAMSSTVAAGP